jgi:hypothetical protein
MQKCSSRQRASSAPCTGAASIWAYSGDELAFVKQPLQHDHAVDFHDRDTEPEGPGRLRNVIDVDDGPFWSMAGEPVLDPLAEVAAAA